MSKILSIAIMAHPKRQHLVQRLQDILGPVPVSYDNGCGLWENRKRATLMYDPAAQFHLVLQEDSILTGDFIKKAEAVLTKQNVFYSLYLGKRSNNRELKKTTPYLFESDWLSWGLAICIPVKKIPKVIASCDGIRAKQDDYRIAHFAKTNKIRIVYPLPSLVDHNGDEESLVGDCKGRKALWFEV